MAFKSGLKLDISLKESLNDDWGENTYRNEGISICTQKARLFGQDIAMAVVYDDLKVGAKIGSGACSSVYVATHNETSDKYAVKMFNTFDSSQTSQMRMEIIALTEVDCETIVKIQGAWHKENRIGLIIEYMDMGSLEIFFTRKFKCIVIPENVLAAFAFQILWGLCYLHYANKMHRDIKPANILLSSKGEVKLSDFGIATLMNETAKMTATSVGTFKYMSPERLLGDRYNATADVWSLGLTLIQMVLRRYPFEDSAATPIDLLSDLEVLDFPAFLGSFKGAPNADVDGDRDHKDGGKYDDSDEEPLFSSGLIEFISAMMKQNCSLRATSEELLHDSEWLALHIPHIPGDSPDRLETCRSIIRDWISANDLVNNE